jgi:hypothetical protein
MSDDIAGGLFCHVNDTRVCGAGCSAYIAVPDEGEDVAAQWKRCRLLVLQHQCNEQLRHIADALQDRAGIRGIG